MVNLTRVVSWTLLVEEAASWNGRWKLAINCPPYRLSLLQKQLKDTGLAICELICEAMKFSVCYLIATYNITFTIVQLHFRRCLHFS